MAGDWTAVRHGPAQGALPLLLHQPNRRAGQQVKKQGLLRQLRQQQRLVQLLSILLLVLLVVLLLAVGHGRKGHGSLGQLHLSTSCSSRTLQGQQLRVQQCLGSRRRRGCRQRQQQQGLKPGLR
jgi:hypothetical protein